MAGGNGRKITRLVAGGASSGATLQDTLDAFAVPGTLWRSEGPGDVRCIACGHRCLIREGRRGICKVRFNHGGVLMAPSGYVVALQADPIEKKPFFHLLPGSDALTFGMLGCDFHCGYCQNWLTSQALRDPDAGTPPTPISAEAVVDLARRRGAASIVSSYNEPMITAEWAVEIFRLARPLGLRTGMVSNGSATPEGLDYLRPWTDAIKVDLKAIDERPYRALGGTLRQVLEAIRMAHERGFWVEVVTLVVPGFNDSDEELTDIAKFLVSVSPDIPWHVTAFHRDYRMTDPDDTPPSTLLRARDIGLETGLHYVYAGNRPGEVGDTENTFCPSCGIALVERWGFRVLSNKIKEGKCFKCGTPIAGRW